MPERDLYGGSDRMYADDYNIGRFGEFDRFQDERSVAPEMFERPQSTIGGYDEQGYTLPASEPNNWWWGYSRPGDVVEQERGVYPFVKRHAPKWSKDIYRDIKGGWEGSSLNPNINPRGMNRGILGTQVAQVNLQDIMNAMPWLNPYRIIKALEAHNIKYANRGGIIGLI